MADIGQAKIEDSNMAMYASPLAKKVRKAAADTEKAWDGAGAKEGLEIWRIENFGVKRWPEEQFGSFYSGDSYIVLHTYKPDPEGGDLDYNVYFWLGKTTTQDEYGTAAYKTVELDDKLGGEPVQYREVQGLESEEFLEIFPEMNIMEGGVASAFNKVEPEKYENKLFIVKGRNKRSVKVSEVPLKVSSLNLSDAFVLDAGLKVFAMLNMGASIWEKRKASEYVDKLQADRPKCEASNVDGLEEGNDAFWEYFGGMPKELNEKAAPVEEEKKEDVMSVYCITDSTGGNVSMKEVEVKTDGDGKLPKDCLDSDNVMMIDTGSVCYVWTGKGASKAEHQFAMPVILENEKYARRPFRKMTEGQERKAFLALFA